MLKSTKNLKVFAMILLMSALLLLAINMNIPSVKAATKTSVFVYTTLGGSVSGNGTALMGGAYSNYTLGDTVSFSATALSGFQFLCFEYASASGALTSTNNPFSETLSAATCAIEAIFIPTTNATASSTTTGAASVAMFNSIGGTTVPAGGITGPVHTGYTVGTASSFTETAGTGFKFLCWVTELSSGGNIYTGSSESLKITATSVAMQAFWIPTSSTVTLPKIVSEFPSAMVAVLLSVLVLIAAATYVYTRKAKK
jgi:hypothetical protein